MFFLDKDREKKFEFIIVFLVLVLILFNYDIFRFLSGLTKNLLYHDSDSQVWFYQVMQRQYPSIYNDPVGQGWLFVHGKFFVMAYKLAIETFQRLGQSDMVRIFAMLNTGIRFLYLVFLSLFIIRITRSAALVLFMGILSIAYFTKLGYPIGIASGTFVPHDIGYLSIPLVFYLYFSGANNRKWWLSSYILAGLVSFAHPSFAEFLLGGMLFTDICTHGLKDKRIYVNLFWGLILSLLALYLFGAFDYINREISFNPMAIAGGQGRYMQEIVDYRLGWRTVQSFLHAFLLNKKFLLALLALIVLKKQTLIKSEYVPRIRYLMLFYLICYFIESLCRSNFCLKLTGDYTLSRIAYVVFCTRELVFLSLMSYIVVFSWVCSLLKEKLFSSFNKDYARLATIVVVGISAFLLTIWHMAAIRGIPIKSEFLNAIYFEDTIDKRQISMDKDSFIIYPAQSDHGMGLALYTKRKFYLSNYSLSDVMTSRKAPIVLNRYINLKKLYDEDCRETEREKAFINIADETKSDLYIYWKGKVPRWANWTRLIDIGSSALYFYDAQ